MAMVSPWFPADVSRLKALDQSVRHGSAAQESGMLHCNKDNKGSTFRFVHVIVIVYMCNIYIYILLMMCLCMSCIMTIP